MLPLILLALCVQCPPAALSSSLSSSPPNFHTVLPERYGDTGPVDGDEYGVRNHVSDHELPRDVPTRVKIVGDLGTPPPAVDVGFVPKQTYVQVRRYDAVKRVPQETAMQEAATSEELANAPRLREVVTHKKTQEVYEEQGYEDAGYDHGGSKKLKVEEEVKDNQSVEVLGPKNSYAQNTEETKDHSASIAPSGRGTWSRHRTTTGKKTKYEEEGDKRKVTTNDNNPVSEKSSGNYTKFDGEKTIVVQNLTETEKKDYKKEGAESRRVASFSKTRDKVEPTTYRPTIRHDSSRYMTKQVKNEQKRNRTRSRPRKRQEADVQKPQSDVIGSYDNSPWIPISPPTDYKSPQTENKKQVKSKINSELREPNSHATKFGYVVNHDTPYKYVFPTDLLSPVSSNKSNRKSRPKLDNSDLTVGKPKGSPFVNYRFIPETNYDGSAINPKQKKLKKSSEEDVSFDNVRLPLNNNKYKEPATQYTIDYTRNTKQEGSATNQRPKNKPIQIGSSEHLNSNLMFEPYREQNKKGNRETQFGNYGSSASRYTGASSHDLGPPKSYDGPPFITKIKKNNYNGDSRGEPTLRVYPKYEFYPHFQNVNHPVKEEVNNGQRPLVNANKGHASIELNDGPTRNIKQENTRLSEYSKFNNRPTKIVKQSAESSESWENYPKIGGQTPQLSAEKYPKYNNGEVYSRDLKKRFESSASTKSSPMYRLIPYEKSVKMNNRYSYVNHDDHYPSGSRYSGVKVEGTTQNPKFSNRSVYLNNRHPHLPKDSVKNVAGEHRGRDKSEEENTRHVENLTLAHYAGLRKPPGSYRPLPLEYNERVNNLAKLLNDNYPRRTRRDVEIINIASSGTTTEIPVDTDVYSQYKKAPKQSALRYATNPNLTPRKTAGGMEFYASTNNVKCNDLTTPTDIVPERTEDGEWLGEPSNGGPRADDIGDKIGCFKKKYFGSDPLDNPIFKEKDVGFPDVLFSVKKTPAKKEEGVKPGKPHVDWDFADELIPSQWFPNKDQRKRRSDNNSVPINHKIQGMASIIPEPVILTFPTKASMVVYNNDTKHNIDDGDSEISSNDEHILKYSVEHPLPKPESSVQKNYIDNKIIGLVPPRQIKKKIKKHHKVKKSMTKKILKKVKVDDDSNEADLLDVFSPITSFFNDEDDVMAAPIVHNFFNIKMTPSSKLKTKTTIDKNSGERINKFKIQNYRRAKRNLKGVDLQRPKQRKLNIDNSTNVSLSSPTARVRMYSPKNGTWFREKRDRLSIDVDIRRKEPRYYYHTESPRIRVKRVVHNPPYYSRTGQVFSSKYLVSDQINSESLPEEINVAFSTTSKPAYESTPKFIPAIAFGDSKTKIINYNDSVANSTNDKEHVQFDKKGSLIYVINPDTGLGKWMQVIKVKNEGDTKSELTNSPVYLEKKIKFEGDTKLTLPNGPIFLDKKIKNEGITKPVSTYSPVFVEKKIKDGVVAESIGKFGFKGSTKDIFKNVLGSSADHRFQIKHPKKETIKNEANEQPKKVICANFLRPKKKEVRRRTTTTTTTTEIPVVEEDLDDRPAGEHSGEEENVELQDDGRDENPAPQEDEGDENAGHQEEEEEEEIEQEEEPRVKRPMYQTHESEENSDNADDQVHEQDQDVYESKQKKPYAKIKKNRN